VTVEFLRQHIVAAGMSLRVRSIDVQHDISAKSLGPETAGPLLLAASKALCCCCATCSLVTYTRSFVLMLRVVWLPCPGHWQLPWLHYLHSLPPRKVSITFVLKLA
jgi:hypothetical protein